MAQLGSPAGNGTRTSANSSGVVIAFAAVWSRSFEQLSAAFVLGIWYSWWAALLKDGNTKESHHSLFTQLADLVSYAALLKLRAEQKKLADWQAELGLGALYDSIPLSALNRRASYTDPQGIVRLG